MLQVTGNRDVNSLHLIKFNRTQWNAIEHNQISWIIKKCKTLIDVRLAYAIEYQLNRFAFD